MELSKNTFLKTTLAVALLASGSAFAAVTSGQLVVVNSLANVVSATGTSGNTASAVSVVVSDATGVCSTTANLAYNGTVTVKWNASATHSASVCTNIASVAVTPLKSVVGTMSTIVYDASAATTVPALVATAPITYTAPTTPITNLALIVTGSGSAASTGSATAWGIALGTVPAFNAANGALVTMGVPGGVGVAGFKAAKLMRQYAVLPFATEVSE